MKSESVQLRWAKIGKIGEKGEGSEQTSLNLLDLNGAPSISKNSNEDEVIQAFLKQLL